MKPNHLAGSTNLARANDDFYKTPTWATEALLEREHFTGLLWEPACGDGAISEVLIARGLNVVSSDLVDRGYGAEMDFLKTHRQVDSIVTNPPYKLATPFIEHALKCANDRVCMLLKLAYLESSGRYEFFQRTPLASVHVFSRRLSFDRGYEKNKGRGLLAFAWYVWQHGHRGPPTIGWIP